jgi:hypothetical protein
MRGKRKKNNGNQVRASSFSYLVCAMADDFLLSVPQAELLQLLSNGGLLSARLSISYAPTLSELTLRRL